MLVHQLAPITVGKDHQLGNNFIERCATLATSDSNYVVIHIKIEVDSIHLLWPESERLALSHACQLKLLRPLPQQRDVILVGILATALSECLLGDLCIEIIVSKIGCDRHPLDQRLGRGDRPCLRIQRRIE